MRAARTAALILLAVGAGMPGLVPSAAAASTGGGGGGSICDGFARGQEIAMYDSCFAGTAHLIEPGTTELSVVNEGMVMHTITAVDGAFDLELAPGERGSVTLSGASVVPMYCTLHGTRDGAGMAGVIVIDADSVGAAAADIPRETVAAATGSGEVAVHDRSGVVWAVLGAVAVAAFGVVGAVRLFAGRRRAAESALAR
jgi:plastocyanin